jgi:hypothetical protein
VQPGVRQQTPMRTDALSITSQVYPEGHLGASGSQTTRALGTLGLSVHAAPSASASPAARATIPPPRDRV